MIQMLSIKLICITCILQKDFSNALDLINEILTQNLNLSKVNQDKVYILYLIKIMRIA